jgi:hypothetical protein
MRTFGTFLAVGILALAAGCGGSSSSGGFTSPTGRTAASGGLLCKSQSCSAKDTYFACAASKCDADAKTCFGPNYASGTFTGACQSFLTCTMGCPCDSTGDACLLGCEAAITSDCVTCSATVQTCAATSGCGAGAPTCANDASTSGTNTSTNTNTNTNTKTNTSTATGTSCATLVACCPSIVALAAGSTTLQECQAGLAAMPDAQCAQLMVQYSTLGLCK